MSNIKDLIELEKQKQRTIELMIAQSNCAAPVDMAESAVSNPLKQIGKQEIELLIRANYSMRTQKKKSLLSLFRGKNIIEDHYKRPFKQDGYIIQMDKNCCIAIPDSNDLKYRKLQSPSVTSKFDKRHYINVGINIRILEKRLSEFSNKNESKKSEKIYYELDGALFPKESLVRLVSACKIIGLSTIIKISGDSASLNIFAGEGVKIMLMPIRCVKIKL